MQNFYSWHHWSLLESISVRSLWWLYFWAYPWYHWSLLESILEVTWDYTFELFLVSLEFHLRVYLRSLEIILLSLSLVSLEFTWEYTWGHLRLYLNFFLVSLEFTWEYTWEYTWGHLRWYLSFFLVSLEFQLRVYTWGHLRFSFKFAPAG